MGITRHISKLILAILLATLIGCAGTATTEGTGEYIDDTVITTKVKAAIFDEPSLKSAQVNVETFKGTVQLSGFVTTRAEVNRASEVARAVNGVTSVKNDIRVK
jgi:osmotically-inducible protein OsmY